MTTNAVPDSASGLDCWLNYLEKIHHRPIDMGLDRVKAVLARLEIERPSVVFTVAGTNGKGSTCAMLDSILVQAGFKVGTYTSPHLIDFNERMRINGEAVSDTTLIDAFVAVQNARFADESEVSLTYFEFTTLAALVIFSRQGLDAWVLEVGLGGRLDAVNAIDTDCAICCSIDLDHKEFLGDTRELIGFEKAGIFRHGKPAIVSDPSPPASVLERAQEIGADLWLFGRDFNYSGDRQQWAYGGRTMRRAALSYPALRGANQLLNASAAIAAIESVKDRLPVQAQAIRQGLLLVDLPGRFQVLPGQPAIVLDVGHNPHAAGHLRESLDNMGFFPWTHCVLGMLSDKDVAGVISQLKDRVDHWHFATLPGPRGLTAERLLELAALAGAEGKMFDWDKYGQTQKGGLVPLQPPEKSQQTYESVAQAYSVALRAAGSNDRILVFGSFLTVAQVLQLRREGKRSGLKPSV